MVWGRNVPDSYNIPNWWGVTKCMHRTAPGKIQYRTDGKSRMLPSNFVPEPSINRMLYSVFKMGMPIIEYIEFSEKVA